MLPCLTRSLFGETSPTGGTGRQAETLLHGTVGTTDIGSPTLFQGRCGRVWGRGRLEQTPSFTPAKARTAVVAHTDLVSTYESTVWNPES